MLIDMIDSALLIYFYLYHIDIIININKKNNNIKYYHIN